MDWFVNPGMVAFTAFGSIPVIIHLLNRQKYKQVQWAAMEFLLKAIKRTHSRLRVENLLLLLARILIMVLLALALAQPLLEQNPLAAFEASDTHLVLVIDHSYSMGQVVAGQTTPLEAAKTVATGLLGGLDASRGDKVSLILMSDNPDAVIAEPSMQIEFATKKVADLDISDFGTRAFETFELVLAAAKASKNARKEVVLISDFQRAAWNVDDAVKEKFRVLLTELTAIAGLKVTLVDVGLPDKANCGIERLSADQKVITVGHPIRYTALVKNWGREEAVGRDLTWYVDGNRVHNDGVHVPAGEASAFTLVHTFTDAGPHHLTAELNADAVQADNKASYAVQAKQHVQVLLVDGDPSADPAKDEVIFLRLALNPSIHPDEIAHIYDVETVRDIVFSETDVRRYDLVIIANLEMIYEENVANLESYVKAGGGLLLWVGDRINRVGYNEHLHKDGAGLLPAELLQAVEPHPDTVYGLEKIDYGHAALEGFKAIPSKLTDLMITRFYTTKVDDRRPDVRVLARYNDADASAALLEKLFGRGKVVLVTTTADLDWHMMIKDPGYLILVDKLAQYLVAQPQGLKNVQVGMPLEYFLNVDQFARSFSLVTPRQGTTSLSPSQVGETGFVLVYRQTDTAGVYALERPAESGAPVAEHPVLSYFAVNVDPREGDLESIGEEDLRQRFPEFKFTWQQRSGAEAEGPAARPPRSSRAWRYLAYGVLALLLAEMFMAQQFGARR